MTSKKLNRILIGGISLLILVLVASVYFGMSTLESSAENLEEAKVQQEVTDSQELALIQAKADIDEYSELEELAQRIIPQEKDQARTVREVLAIAEEAGVNLTTIAFPTSSLGAEQAANQSVVTQATPVEGIPDLLELQMTLSVSEEAQVTYGQFIAFLEGLEQNRRTSQVESVSIIPNEDDRNRLTFNINLAVYIKP